MAQKVYQFYPLYNRRYRRGVIGSEPIGIDAGECGPTRSAGGKGGPHAGRSPAPLSPPGFRANRIAWNRLPMAGPEGALNGICEGCLPSLDIPPVSSEAGWIGAERSGRRRILPVDDTIRLLARPGALAISPRGAAGRWLGQKRPLAEPGGHLVAGRIGRCLPAPGRTEGGPAPLRPKWPCVRIPASVSDGSRAKSGLPPLFFM